MRIRTLSHRTGVADTRTTKPAPKRADPFYLSPEWTQLRSTLIRTRGARCQDCGRTDGRLFADHVVELQDGGAALDPANVRLLCQSCHGTKTVAERAKRMARPV